MPKEIQIEFIDGTIKKYRDQGWGMGKRTYQISIDGDNLIVEEREERGIISPFKEKDEYKYRFKVSNIKKIRVSSSQPTSLQRRVPFPPGETQSFNSTLLVSTRTYTNINGRLVEGDFDLPEDKEPGDWDDEF